jgi:hypothetical protein
MRPICRIPAGGDQGVRNAKKASEKVGFFDIVEAPSNGHPIKIQTNKSRILSAYKYAEDMNAKLTLRVSSSVRGQLVTKKSSVIRVILKAKVVCFKSQRVLWVTEWVRCKYPRS